MVLRKSVDGDPRVVGPGVEAGRHSRVVSCMDAVVAGFPGFGLTQRVGQRVWLLGVRLWHRHAGVTSEGYTSVQFFTGTTLISTEAEMLLWDEVLPVSGAGDDLIFWRLYDEWPSMAWSMNRLFIGEGRRFGFHATRALGYLADEMYVSFEISEG